MSESRRILRIILWRASSTLLVSFSTVLALTRSLSAQIYNGPGVEGGVGAAAGIAGVSGGSLRQVIGNIVNTALNYAALIAVAVIVIAGFYFIFSLGDDSKRQTATKIILYTGIGLIILLTAKIIVGFFLSLPF